MQKIEAGRQAHLVDQAWGFFWDAGLVDPSDRRIVGGFLANCEVVRIEVSSVELGFLYWMEKGYSIFHPVKFSRNPVDGSTQLYQDLFTFDGRTKPRWQLTLSDVQKISYRSSSRRERYIFQGHINGQSQISEFFP